MGSSDDGLPDYEAHCRPSSLSFTYRPPGHETRITRDLDFRSLVANAPPELLISWASFQTLCGIESVLKSIDGHLAELAQISKSARAAATAQMPSMKDVLAMVRSELGAAGMRMPPKQEPG